MKLFRKKYKADASSKLPVSRPTVMTLLLRIAASALTGGMRWLLFFAGVMIVFLHYNHFPVDGLLVLMLFAVLVVAVFRGIRAWQDDIDEYQRNLTEYRMNMADNRKKHEVKKDIIWNRR